MCACLSTSCGDAAVEDPGAAGIGGVGGWPATGGAGGTGGSPSLVGFSVTLLDRTGLLGQRPVMYADADGKHVRTELTSAGGVARFENVPAGGFVTAAVVDTERALGLQTVGGIGDRDSIVLIATEAFGIPLTQSMGRAAITVSNLPEGASRFRLLQPGHWSNFEEDVPFTSEVSFSTQAIGPSGTYNALAVAELPGDEIAFGIASSLSLEGLIPDVTVATQIESWQAPSGTVRAELRNLSEVELPVAMLVGGYRDTQQFYIESGGQDLPPGATLSTELRVSANFHDRTIATFVLDVFGDPVALANERFVASTSVPDEGQTEVIWTSTDEFLPTLITAGHDFEERSATYFWTRPPRCDGVAPNVSLFELVGSRDSKQYSWKMLTPYRDEIRMPELDPEYVAMLFPPDLEEERWSLEARAYPEGSFDSVRRSSPALLPPRAWLARRRDAESVCVSRARTGGPR